MTKVYRTRGEAALAKSLKELCNRLRKWSLSGAVETEKGLCYKPSRFLRGCLSLSCFRGHGLSVVLFQASRLARALPKPPCSMIKSKLRDHTRRLTVPFEAPNADRLSFESFCTIRCQRLRVARGTFSLSQSASFSQTRLTGGHLAEVASRVEEFRLTLIPRSEAMKLVNKTPWDLFGEFILLDPADALPELVEPQAWFLKFRKDYELSLMDFELLRENLFAVWWAYLSMDWDRSPRCRQLAVAERGYKWRIVTPVEAGLQLLGSVWNGLLLDLVRTCECTNAGLDGPAVMHLPFYEEEDRHVLLRSLDLETASDMLPLDLMASGVKGIIRGLGYTGVWATVLYRLIGSFDMHLRIKGKEYVVATKRGLLMGSPVAWPLLGLYVDWMFHQSFIESGDLGYLPWHAVVGDDLLGKVSLQTNRSLDAILSRTGGVISTGKDFLEHHGCLCEEMLTSSLIWVPTVSVRFACGIPKHDVPMWAMGPSASATLQLLPSGLRERVARIYYGNIASSLHLLRRNSVDPFLPRCVGGGGFLPLRGTFTGLGGQLLRALWSQGQVVGQDLRIRFHGAWAVGAYHPMILEEATEYVRVQCAEFRTTPSDGDPLVTESDVLAGECAARAFIALAVPPPRGLRPYSLSRVAKRLSVLRTELLARSYWAAGCVVDAPSDLLAKVAEWDRLACHFNASSSLRLYVHLTKGLHAQRLCIGTKLN